MALNAKNAAGGGSPANYEPMLGTYPARLVGILDLGLQAQRPYKGEEKKPAYEIMLTFEFVDEFMQDEDGQDMEDKPRWLSERMPLYNLNAERARSTQRYNALDPSGAYDGEFGKLVDTPCNVTVVQNPGKGKNVGKTYENIEAVSVMRAKDAAKCQPLVNAVVVFDLDDPDMDTWKLIPEWTQKIIKENLEFAGSVLANLLGDKTEPAPEKAEDASPDEGDGGEDRPF